MFIASGFSHRTILPAAIARQRNLGVRVVGRADVDRIDILALDQLAPVGLDRLVAPLLGEILGPLGRSPADRLQHRPVGQVKEIVDPLVGVGMRPAHEAIADDADIEGFLF